MYHLTLNLLLHYLVKSECSAVHCFTTVVQLESGASKHVEATDFSSLFTCLHWFIYDVFKMSAMSTQHAHMHA